MTTAQRTEHHGPAASGVCHEEPAKGASPFDATFAWETHRREEPRWTQQSVSEVYSGRVIIREHLVALPNGMRTTYEVDESIPFAVAVLAQPDPGRVILARQYRYPLDRWIYDLPGGAGNPGEDPEDAARRECEEEIGGIPGALTHLHTFFTNPGRTAWPTHLYYASELDHGTADTTDASESVAKVVLDVETVDSLIEGGDVIDPGLLIAWATAQRRGLIGPVGQR